MLNYVGLNPDPRKINYSLIITTKQKNSIKEIIENKLLLKLNNKYRLTENQKKPKKYKAPNQNLDQRTR